MQCTLAQLFGLNANNTYKAGGLSGHTGVDAHCGYGTSIYSRYDGIVYKVLTKDNPANDGTGFTSVFMIVDDGIECFEWLVGHCDPCVSVGQIIKKGDLIGHEANHGTVFQDGLQITLAMQKAGDQRGSHRHYQKRAIMPVKRTDYGRQYLTGQGTGSPYWDSEKQCYYEIINYYNGFNGCQDPLQPILGRTLMIGSSGADVFVLQRILAKYGYLTVEPTAYFGMKTATALMQCQKANGISPFPIFGPKSRQLALRELSPLPLLLGY